MGFLKKNDDDFPYLTDRLVVIDIDKRTSDVVYVDHVDDVAVTAAGRYKVPREDCELFNSPDGLIYIMKADTQYISETRRLAALEKSVVLRHLTMYNPEPEPNPNLDFFKWGLFGLLFVAIIALAF